MFILLLISCLLVKLVEIMKYVWWAAIHWITFTANCPLCPHSATLQCTLEKSAAQLCIYSQLYFSLQHTPLHPTCVQHVAAIHRSTVSCSPAAVHCSVEVIQCLALLPGAGARVLGKKRQLLPRFRIPPVQKLDLVRAVHQMIPKRLTNVAAN